jgi:predicted DNA-binding transcriptional regulator AlpA
MQVGQQRLRLDLTLFGASPVTQRIERPIPVAGSIGDVEEFTGLSRSSVRRLSASDPDSPKPFRVTENGHPRWPVAEIIGYLSRKAGPPLLAA